MALAGASPVMGIEGKRLELEESVAKLRKALNHWQQWEIEYGDFKEQLEDLPEHSTNSLMVQLGTSLDSHLITQKEVEEIVGLDKKLNRTRDQVIGIVARRIDYVQRNAQSIQKQLDLREKDLGGLLDMDEELNTADEEYPIMEITEELDEDGNVLSSSISTANDAATDVLKVLDKAGMSDWVDGKDTAAPTSNEAAPSTISAATVLEKLQTSPIFPLGLDRTPPTKSSKRKKTVTFAENVDVSESSAHAPASPPPSALPPTPLKNKFEDSWEVQESRRGRFHDGDRVIELNDGDEEIGSLPIVEREDETPEEARLRREMAKYAFGEVGAIVAEMDIEEGGAFDDSDDVFDEDEEDEDENQFGMTTKDLISEQDKQEMLRLEQKLKERLIHNAGSDAEASRLDQYAGDVRRLVIQPDKPANPDEKLTSDAKSTKKGVRFSSDVEVAPSPADASKPTVNGKEFGSTSIADDDIEHAPNASMPSATESRLRGARSKKITANGSSKTGGARSHRTPSIPIYMRDDNSAVSMPETPQGPPGKTLSAEVMERSTSVSQMSPESSDTHPALLQQELAVESRRRLNELVHKTGGFTLSSDDEDNPIVEEVNGKVQKVSRFKAARLKAAGM